MNLFTLALHTGNDVVDLLVVRSTSRKPFLWIQATPPAIICSEGGVSGCVFMWRYVEANEANLQFLWSLFSSARTNIYYVIDYTQLNL